MDGRGGVVFVVPGGDGESEGERQGLAEPSNASSAQASNRSTDAYQKVTLRGDESMFDSMRYDAACSTEAGAAWVTYHFLVMSSCLPELKGKLTKCSFPDNRCTKQDCLKLRG
jgi:hypothetical protein